jgi:alkylation response protein AidB-like acyl-CoA dehydrogenase
MGWLGLAVPEDRGGEGFGLAELVVVIEELGRALVPGPFVPTALTALAIDRWGSDDQRETWLARLCDGSARGAVAFAGRPVLGGAHADVFVVPGWGLLPRADVGIEPLRSLDETRRVVEVRVPAAGVAADQELNGATTEGILDLAAVVFGAEAVGGATWCVDTAATYARDRRQFGRPIGQFQAVKHRCADMLCRTELARAAVWDAARGTGEPDQLALAASAAGALAPDAFFESTKDCIQVLGGIGFTWEHDVHLYFKRATTIRQLLGGGQRWRSRVLELALGGVDRTLEVELPPEAQPVRDKVRGFVGDLAERPKTEWNSRLAESGYLVPNWPAPWGRDAGPLEQLVIDQELRAARIRRPHLAVGGWALPTIIAHGTPAQQERWIMPTLRGEVTWCQLFSEPGAGSDLASLTTRAERAVGAAGAQGWVLTGQKVWTTLAHQAQWGICLARTNPDVPKHEGISCFMVDMAAPGIDIRPLRELTGAEMFNEVFFDEVFVPDDCVVGEIHHGWEAARTTLANERVSMGAGSSMGPGVRALLDLAAQEGRIDDPVVRDQLGAVVVDTHALAVMGMRMTLRALTGAEPGSESSVRKLIGVEHDQWVQELGLGLLGPDSAVNEGDASVWIFGFLGNRSLSIAGGTSEIQRNVIAERLLDLPKDP